MHGSDFIKDLQRTVNPYFNTDYKSLYNFNLEKETFSNIKDTRIKNYTVQAKTAAQSNQSIKIAKLTKVMKLQIIIKNLFTDLSNYKIIKKPKYILKTKTETTTKPKLVMGIETLLDTMSITLQNGRKSN